MGSNEDFWRKTVLFSPILPCGGGKRQRRTKIARTGICSGNFGSVLFLGGGVLLFKLRAQHAVFSLQGVELVIQRGELLFELARDDALIEFVPARAQRSPRARGKCGWFRAFSSDRPP